MVWFSGVDQMSVLSVHRGSTPTRADSNVTTTDPRVELGKGSGAVLQLQQAPAAGQSTQVTVKDHQGAMTPVILEGMHTPSSIGQ
jgi:hypothetical protein